MKALKKDRYELNTKITASAEEALPLEYATRGLLWSKG